MVELKSLSFFEQCLIYRIHNRIKEVTGIVFIVLVISNICREILTRSGLNVAVSNIVGLNVVGIN